METHYRWRVGSYFTIADANIVGNEISSLQKITPENVVKFARNEETELHKLFEWNDTEAGEKWRKHQASMILGDLKVVVKKQEDNQVQEKVTRAFVTLGYKKEYETIQSVVKEPEKYDLLLERATERLRSIRNTYAELAELREIFELIDKL